jgi:GNAT superfamily N-acetyltransferase
MMVHPNHQRKGIGKKLLQWGLDRADKEKIVSWLFARPAAAKMYRNAGFKPVGLLEVHVPEDDEPLDVVPGEAMLREPQPYMGT